ncbi:Uncharacterized protein PBTT_10147 [Plasmodiophora brassicae]
MAPAIHFIVLLLLIFLLSGVVYRGPSRYLHGSSQPRIDQFPRPRLQQVHTSLPPDQVVEASLESYQRLLKLSQEQFTRTQRPWYRFLWVPAPDFNATVHTWHCERERLNLPRASDDDVSLFTEIARTGSCTDLHRIEALTNSNMSLQTSAPLSSLSSMPLLSRIPIPSFGSLGNWIGRQPSAPVQDADAYRALRDLCLAKHKRRWNPFSSRIPETFEDAFWQWDVTWSAPLQHELHPGDQAIDQFRQLFDRGSCDDRRPIARLTSSSFLAPTCTQLLYDLHVLARQAFDTDSPFQWTFELFDDAHGKECSLTLDDFSLFVEVATSGTCGDSGRYRVMTGVAPSYVVPEPGLPTTTTMRDWLRNQLNSCRRRLPKWTEAFSDPSRYVQEQVESTVPAVRNVRSWYKRVVNVVNRTRAVISSPGRAVRDLKETFAKGNLATKTKIVMTAVLAGSLATQIAILSGKTTFRIGKSIARPLKPKTVWIPAAVLSSMFLASKLCDKTASLQWACRHLCH